MEAWSAKFWRGNGAGYQDTNQAVRRNGDFKGKEKLATLRKVERDAVQLRIGRSYILFRSGTVQEFLLGECSFLKLNIV